jgi:hypothetical protein
VVTCVVPVYIAKMSVLVLSARNIPVIRATAIKQRFSAFFSSRSIVMNRTEHLNVRPGVQNANSIQLALFYCNFINTSYMVLF